MYLYARTVAISKHSSTSHFISPPSLDSGPAARLVVGALRERHLRLVYEDPLDPLDRPPLPRAAIVPDEPAASALRDDHPVVRRGLLTHDHGSAFSYPATCPRLRGSLISGLAGT